MAGELGTLKEYKGYYVHCFQKVPEGPQTPFIGKIKGETGYQWVVQVCNSKAKPIKPSQEVKVHKASCSKVPFKNFAEAKTKAYREKVFKKDDSEQATMEASSKNPSVHKKATKSVRRKRPRNGKDTSTSGKFRSAEKAKRGMPVGNSPKESLADRMAKRRK